MAALIEEKPNKEELVRLIDEADKRLEAVSMIGSVLAQHPKNMRVENIVKIYEQMPDRKIGEILPGLRGRIKQLTAQRHGLLMELKKVAPMEIRRVPIVSLSAIYEVLPPVYSHIFAIVNYFSKTEPSVPLKKEKLIQKVIETYGGVREEAEDALDDLIKMGAVTLGDDGSVSI